ncbi:MAG: hypothetical protein QNJ63_17180 [Calothrix sp. MO_192.B10]|nr:hypothetical protein [Calothrix sp. MO_192.B10]
MSQTLFTLVLPQRNPITKQKNINNMTFELFQCVALNRDLPEHQLKKGDVAT